MSAVTWIPGVYYQVLDSFTTFGATEVENWPCCVPLAKDEVVLCVGFVHRKGAKGRGRYAKLLHMRDGRNVVLYHRVSRNNIGSGSWAELNAMLVLVMTGEIPII